MESLLAIETAPEFAFIEETIKNPKNILHATISQKYDDEESGLETEYCGTITYMAGNEFTFDVSPEKPEYLTVEEVIADLDSGDIRVVEF